MDGKTLTMARVLTAASNYRIPPYQRAYQWDFDRWHGLARDSHQLATRSQFDPPHWLGILLLSDESGVKVPGDDSHQIYTVIDGQQRLTTTILWLAAIAHHADDQGQPVPLDVARLSPLRVQEIDRVPFKAACEGSWRQARNVTQLRSRALTAYSYFRWLLYLGQDALSEEEYVKMPVLKAEAEAGKFEKQWERYLNSKAGANTPRGEPVDATSLADNVRNETTVYALVHEPSRDESQAVIFDTLNGMRTELQPLDHIRNSLFVRLPIRHVKRLYQKGWEPNEHRLRQVRLRGVTVERAFLYDFLIAQGEKGRQKSISSARGSSHFNVMTKAFSDAQLVHFVESEVLPAMAAWPAVVRDTDEILVDGSVRKPKLATLQRMTTIRNLSSNPANPVVLHFLTAWATGDIAEQELGAALKYLESYIARLVLAGRPLSPLRARIMDVMGELDRSLDPENLRFILKMLDVPSNDEILDIAPKRPIYAEAGGGVCLALLRGIESELSGAGANFFMHGSGEGEYTVEHVFPQKPEKWLDDLARWRTDLHRLQEVQHTIGNLAPVTATHNSSVGNKTFADKKKHPTVHGNAAPLRVNERWQKSVRWTEKQVLARGEALVKAATRRWKL